MLDEFAYTIPEQLIAHTPAEPRESARLLVYHTKQNKIEHSRIADLPSYIAGCHMVVNDTTVLPARMHGLVNNEAIELLLLVDRGIEDGCIHALVNRRVQVGDSIVVLYHSFTVLANHDKAMLLRFSGSNDELLMLIDAVGQTPLPPYINSFVDENVRRLQYQTMFADSTPSVAAPTASLHFTPSLVAELTAAGVTKSAITLQVGLGTFAPVLPEHLVNKTLHTERYKISKESAVRILSARAHGRPIVGVGTTVVRTLESTKAEISEGREVTGETNIFITPPYHFTFPDILLTNFHVPRSSLMCLVQAFIDDKGGTRHLIEIYKEAIAMKYRFYSFGDAMLIL